MTQWQSSPRLHITYREAKNALSKVCKKLLNFWIFSLLAALLPAQAPRTKTRISSPNATSPSNSLCQGLSHLQPRLRKDCHKTHLPLVLLDCPHTESDGFPTLRGPSPHRFRCLEDTGKAEESSQLLPNCSLWLQMEFAV